MIWNESQLLYDYLCYHNPINHSCICFFLEIPVLVGSNRLTTFPIIGGQNYNRSRRIIITGTDCGEMQMR